MRANASATSSDTQMNEPKPTPIQNHIGTPPSADAQ
jgi:hypothetical protein